MRRHPFTKLAIWLVALYVIYVGSYCWLSARGRYEPACFGINVVKWYAWAPSGFVKDFQWNPTLMRVYHPLLWLDEEYWHTHRDFDLGRYPINEVGPGDFGKIARVWRRLRRGGPQ